MERRTLPELVDEKSLFDDYWLDVFLPRLGESFVGVFGWMDVPLPALIHQFYLGLGGVAVVGLVLGVRSEADRAPIVLSSALIGACFAESICNLSHTQYQTASCSGGISHQR
jgi:hypothetical protein